MDANYEETFKMIELYEQFPCLWNYSSPIYKNVSIKNNAWKEIANAVGKTVEEVKKKIKHLRSAYVVEKKKVDASKKSGSSADSIHIPHLYYYSNMDFLAPVVVLRKTISNLKEEEDPKNIIEIDSEVVIESQENEQYPTEEAYKSADNNYSSIGMCCTPASSKSIKKIKMERDEKFNNALDVIIKKANDTSCNDETMYSAFGKSIALQLKELPLSIAANVMAEMQKYISSVVQHHFKNDILHAATTNANIYELNC